MHFKKLWFYSENICQSLISNKVLIIYSKKNLIQGIALFFNFVDFFIKKNSN